MTVDDEEERAANEATCEEPSCHEPILLTTEECELVRDNSTYFFIVSGHPTHGEVVSERDGYTIVQKTGRGGAVAARTDPRKEEA